MSITDQIKQLLDESSKRAEGLDALCRRALVPPFATNAILLARDAALRVAVEEISKQRLRFEIEGFAGGVSAMDNALASILALLKGEAK